MVVAFQGLKPLATVVRPTGEEALAASCQWHPAGKPPAGP